MAWLSPFIFYLIYFFKAAKNAKGGCNEWDNMQHYTPQATAVKLAQLGEGDSPQCG